MEADWLRGLLGGLMIGLAAAVYLLGNGRIMGASGILGSLVDGSAGRDRPMRLAFVAALVAVPALLWLAVPDLAPLGTQASRQPLVLIAAGLMVGIGTRLGSGCTSGHGVCGLSRLSPRGIAATLAYLGAGMLTVALFRHMLTVI